MFEFRIDNARAAHKLMQDGWPTKIVSLVGPDLNFELPHQGDHHIMKVFHDFEGPVNPATLVGTTWDLKGHEVILPTMQDIEDVLEFCEGLCDEDRLLVHCHAGRSRSAAMLIGILYNNYMTAEEAVAAVAAIRPTMIPNRLIIEMIDEICTLDEDPPLSLAVKNYWDSYTGADKDLRTKYSGWKE
jgi:predicted protein tyrosine phosphatase